jgi:hypothetical protein
MQTPAAQNAASTCTVDACSTSSPSGRVCFLALALQASVVVLNATVGALHEGSLAAALLGLLLQGEEEENGLSADAHSNEGPTSSSGRTIYVAAAAHLQHGKDAGERQPAGQLSLYISWGVARVRLRRGARSSACLGHCQPHATC